MNNIPPIIHSSWYPLMEELMNHESITQLRYQILPKCSFLPESSKIFSCFSTPLDEINVVLIGKEPYLTQDTTSTGLAFGVSSTDASPLPYSLMQIENQVIVSEFELTPRDDYNLCSTYSNETQDYFNQVNRHFIHNGLSENQWKTLEHWKQQGVLLLNSALTVETGKPGTHIKAWSYFTRRVIDYISKNRECAWMLWGKDAQSFTPYINNLVNNHLSKGNVIFPTIHPIATQHDDKLVFDPQLDSINYYLQIQSKNRIIW